MPIPPFDRFVRHPELTELLHAFAAEHPSLVEVTSIGKSHEQRDIWLATVTNTETGPAHEKPALWIDANIHATELTGSLAVLHLLSRLVTDYGRDERITRVLDTRTFYLVPRLNPDGAELAMAERPVHIRSSVRPWPRPEQQDGLVEQDIDGDGRILMMRVPDPQGPWKLYPDDARLLVPRDADDDGPGPYYRLLYEGRIQNFDGVTIKPAPQLMGLDLNRNFPYEWRLEADQAGAGPYPTSEPEVRTVVQAIVDRPNICHYLAYHTYSGVLLRPYGTKSDDELPTVDLRLFKKIGQKGTELTGYPAVSVFHDFRYDPKDNITGVADDWAYDHLGVFAWTTEFWSPQRAAGIESYDFIGWYDEHPLDDDLKLLAWSDEQLGGRGFVDWYPFDHPELGPVELGGWDEAYCWRNPPRHLLEAEVAPHTEWAIWQALVSPRVEFLSLSASRVEGSDDVWRIRAVVQNTGWLPTNVTQKALDRKAVRPLEAELVLPDGAELLSGQAKVELGQLTGRALKQSMQSWGGGDATTDRAKVDWVIRVPQPAATVRVEARHDRAGVVRSELRLA